MQSLRNWRIPNQSSCGKFSADGHNVSLLWAPYAWWIFGDDLKPAAVCAALQPHDSSAAANQKAGQSIFLYPFSLLRRFFFISFAFASPEVVPQTPTVQNGGANNNNNKFSCGNCHSIRSHFPSRFFYFPMNFALKYSEKNELGKNQTFAWHCSDETRRDTRRCECVAGHEASKPICRCVSRQFHSLRHYIGLRRTQKHSRRHWFALPMVHFAHIITHYLTSTIM